MLFNSWSLDKREVCMGGGGVQSQGSLIVFHSFLLLSCWYRAEVRRKEKQSMPRLHRWHELCLCGGSRGLGNSVAKPKRWGHQQPARTEVNKDDDHNTWVLFYVSSTLAAAFKSNRGTCGLSPSYVSEYKVVRDGARVMCGWLWAHARVNGSSTLNTTPECTQRTQHSTHHTAQGGRR